MKIGGGAAGLESAAQLISLGYKPVIVEKEESLGGNIKNWDRLFPDGIEAKAVLDGLLKRSSLSDIYLNSNVIEVNNSNNNFTVTLSNNNVIKADSILITTGFDVFKAERKEEYGYGIYDHVITNVDLEKFFQSKHDERINSPKKIGFVHYVGHWVCQMIGRKKPAEMAGVGFKGRGISEVVPSALRHLSRGFSLNCAVARWPVAVIRCANDPLLRFDPVLRHPPRCNCHVPTLPLQPAWRCSTHGW